MAVASEALATGAWSHRVAAVAHGGAAHRYAAGHSVQLGQVMTARFGALAGGKK